ncbi:LysR family transcriptional regulator [Gordonia sp. (in: high G+C Gram-positive bacteria)]|uniref:LysR family transcriptional regulator n=1 Tax=Gordonia sp. (in: high G+C Gram-positive bacteria) TaxID=84139 RepID=UPI003F95CCF4
MPDSIDARSVRADDLRYLLAVARAGSRAVAATDLGVDSSTVTRRMRALEQLLGVRLVEQGVDGWELTEIGRDVAERAAPIESAVESAIDVVAGARTNSLRGNVRITAPDAFGAYFVAPAMARLRNANPDLTVEVLTATRQLNLHQSGFDVAIAVGVPMSGKLVTAPLTEYALGLYATDDYFRAHPVPRTTADLIEHSLIWYVDSLLQVGDLDLEHHLPALTSRLMSTNVFAQVEATRAGGGIGLLPAFVATRHPDLKRVLGDDVEIRMDFSFAARRERLTSPTVQAIHAALRAEVDARTTELLP